MHPVEVIKVATAQLPGFVTGALLALFGIWLRARVDRGDRRAEAARGLITPAKPILEQLQNARVHLDALMINPDALGHYYRAKVAVVPEQDETGLDRAIVAGVALPQGCLDQWRRSLELIRELRGRHAEGVNVVGRPQSSVRLSATAGEYRRVLVEAADAIGTAIRVTRPHASSDVRNATRSLGEER